MIPEFIDFCQKLFPCIDPYTRDQAKKAMAQFDGVAGPFLTKQCHDFDMFQGDIFSEIPFIYTNDEGRMQIIKRKAMLLSNTCDATRDDCLLFAALHPLAEIATNTSMVDAVKKNKRFSAFYLPDRTLHDEYVDFELINTISRESFLKMNTMGKVKRIASLTLVGYYMFICKLTVFFMRPEDEDVNASR